MQREKIDIQEGLSSYLSKLTQAPLLSAEEEVELTRLSQQGDCAARQRIVEANMRLVISIARAYRSKAVPLEDLIQEGAIGLMHAVERFDPEKGFRFSTYATHWVRQSIGRALDNKAKAIRIPAHISQTLRKIEREKAKLTRDLGGEPSQEELALAMGITPRKLSALYQCAREMVSLDTKIG
jgi:RNA polymerase primary sigma factor